MIFVPFFSLAEGISDRTPPTGTVAVRAGLELRCGGAASQSGEVRAASLGLDPVGAGVAGSRFARFFSPGVSGAVYGFTFGDTSCLTPCRTAIFLGAVRF